MTREPIEVTRQEPCDDAISREFLLLDLLLKAQGEKDVSIKWLEEYINSLPSVTPQPRKAHWIEHEKSISTGFRHLRECSNCNCYFDWSMSRNSFCPNCGSDMR